MKAAYTDSSSTSSSRVLPEPRALAGADCGALEPPVLVDPPATGAIRVDKRSIARRWGVRSLPVLRLKVPSGALAACLIVAVIHFVVAVFVYPHPVAPSRLRHKVLALTRHDRPGLLIAGDSRAEWHIIPDILAERVGVPLSEVVNIAVQNCESAAVWASYREFSRRFPPRPIMLLSVSFWSVNDSHNRGVQLVNDETLWSMTLTDRLRIVPVKRALMSMFLAEKVLWQHMTVSVAASSTPVRDRGFKSQRKHITMAPDALAHRINDLWHSWFAEAKVDGVRWRELVANVRRLQGAGVQLVILDSPEHPALLAALQGSPGEGPNNRYHRQLAQLGERLSIPVLRYEPDRFTGLDPNMLYSDLLHLNRDGAVLLTEWVGDDLKDLISRDVLQLPDQQINAETQKRTNIETQKHRNPTTDD